MPYLIRVEQDDDIVEAFGQVQQHIVDPANGYNRDLRLDWELGTVADPWIIATGLARDCTVVTYEKRLKVRGNQPRKDGTWAIKIPDVCDEMGVRTRDFLDVMTDLPLRVDAGIEH